MADTVFALNSIPATTVLSEDLLTQAMYSSVVSRFIGDDDDAMVRIMPDLTRRAGDTIDYELELNLLGPGVMGFDQLEGQEEAMAYVFDGFAINSIAHAISIKGQMTLQRVPWGLRKRAKRLLQKWLTRRMNVSFVNQLCGNTAGAGLGVSGVTAGDLRFTGLNAALAPSSTTLTGARTVFPSGFTAESSITSAGSNGANQLALPLINAAAVKAETSLFPIRPIVVNGEPFYVLFAHPFSINDLKNAVNEGTWQHIQLQAMSSGVDYVKNNPLFTGAIGMYNRVIIHKDMHTVFGSNQQINATAGLGTSIGVGGTPASPTAGITNVSRALFCGANAGVLAFGRYTDWPSQVKWVEAAKDYNRKLGVACEVVFGMKKSQFTFTGDNAASDFGTIVISHWANAQ